ncbi:hypothetical protein LSUE1_G009201 [Lachnellula suecica]|uniref:Uncharacterized protein n=1 Tax=Lachnellula suecica TaxID=602035 RepID=A0A8T9BUI9_9HELO|nr:hypothetical protein LSUE1_G009201 [Lachnellula suecica]
MASAFVPRHIPALLVTTSMTLGGTMPLFNPVRAITTFGFPQRIAVSKPAHPVMVVGSARVSAIGIALWALYLKGQFEAMDVVFASLGYLALVDGEGGWRPAVFRAVSAGLVALGAVGMTAGR